MKNVQLLDCTLRDGGYVNDWKFGYGTMLSILERQIGSGVDLIEVGFLDQREPFDRNRTIQPDTGSYDKIFGRVNKRGALTVAMIDYGTCGIERLGPRKDGWLDGIRVIFKKHRMREAIAFCHGVKALGYEVCTQAVSVTSYNDRELVELSQLVNELQPYAISLVDTYGLMHQENVMHIFHILDKNLLPGIRLAYHAHNNFQMGYANCIEMLNAETDRSLLVDGSLYGMGKSAGNAPIELLAMYMNENFGKRYDQAQMLEAIETDILPIYAKVPWGYNLFYYIAASNKCHPNYVSFLMNRSTLSVRGMQELLQRIPEEKKLLYDQKCVEALYLDYQTRECDDTAAFARLSAAMKGRSVLAVGPGKSVVEARSAIDGYIRKNRPLVIPLNFLPEGMPADFLFVSNAKRYGQMICCLDEPEREGVPVIATSNVLAAGSPFDYLLNYGALIDPDTEIPDNSLAMLLRALARLGVRHVALAGFDGYSSKEMNYYRTNMEYDFAQRKADYLNGYIRGVLKTLPKETTVEFITPSKYTEA